MRRRSDLSSFLEENNPDIVALSETKLTPSHSISFRNYKIFRTDRPNSCRSGGTAILLKNNFDCTHVINSTIIANKLVETTIIQIKIRGNKNLFVIATYIPYKKASTAYKRELQLLFETLQLDSHRNFYLLLGDLNAKHSDWNNKSTCDRGRFLSKFINDNEIKYRMQLYHSNVPSFIRSGSYIDLIIADRRINISTVINNSNKVDTIEYDSDHRALVFNSMILGESLIPIENTYTQGFFSYKKAKWNKFRKILSKKDNIKIPPDKCLDNKEIDQYLELISSNIQEAMLLSIPLVQKQSPANTDKYINKEILALKLQKSKILTQLNKCKKLSNQNTSNRYYKLHKMFKIIINDINKKLDVQFKKSQNDHWLNIISNIPHNDSQSMFPQINKIFRRKGNHTIHKITTSNTQLLLRTNISTEHLDINKNTGDYSFNDINKCINIIGAHFENIHTSNTELGNKTMTENITKNLNRFIPCNKTIFSIDNPANGNEILSISDNPLFTNNDNIRLILKNLKNKTSTGLDNIPNIALKNLPENVVNNYCILFNNLSNNGYYPKSWKVAKVIPLAKKNKDNTDPSSYRPISLLPTISKVYENIINKSLTLEVESLNIIPDNQFGFRKGHSTTHAINRLVSDTNWNFNAKKCTGAVFIDLEKAFDTVWLDGLISTMIDYRINKFIIAIIANMIKGKEFVVSADGVTTEIKFKIKEGLQQGTVNAPLLFNIYTAELLRKLDNAIAFADDVVIYCSDAKITKIEQQLTNQCNIAKKFLDERKLALNVAKCESILFHINIRDASRDTRTYYKKFNIKIDQQVINRKQIIKYLGVHLDEKLKFDKHVDIQIKKAKEAFNKTWRLFYSYALHPSIKVIAYQTLIRPIITYGCAIWYNITDGKMENMRKFERACLRSCTGKFFSKSSGYTKFKKTIEVYNIANIGRIDNHIIKLTRNHCLRSSMDTMNNLIYGPFYDINAIFYQKIKKTGYIPPEYFVELDKEGLIQDLNSNIPLLYHVHRIRMDKMINYANDIFVKENQLLKHDMRIPKRDIINEGKVRKKYWWLVKQDIQ